METIGRTFARAVAAVSRHRSALALVAVLAVPATASANPIVVSSTEYGVLRSDSHLIHNYALITIAALSLEYLSFRWFFRRQLGIGRAIAVFAGLHAISWPLTQVASLGISILCLPILGIDLVPLAEVVAILLESFLLKRFLRIRTRRGRRHVLVAMVVGNAVSFATGWALFAWLGYQVILSR